MHGKTAALCSNARGAPLASHPDITELMGTATCYGQADIWQPIAGRHVHPQVCGVHKQRNIAIHLEYFTYLHCVYQRVTHGHGRHLQGQSVCVCVCVGYNIIWCD